MKASVVVVVVLAGCSWAGVAGSGEAKREVRPVGGFTAVEIKGAVGCELVIAAESHVEVSGDDNLVPLVTTEVAGDKLTIDTRKDVRPKLPLVARITAPRLTAVRVSGSSRVAMHAVQGDSLTLDVSGSATIAGDGTIQQLVLDISGSGSAELDKLAAERARVKISGSGSVDLSVSKTLDVDISGSGSVSYRGDPEVKKEVSGSGRIVKR